jgi:hypothetical protein
MGILKSAADLVYTIRFLKLLVTKFEDTGAYKDQKFLNGHDGQS